MERLSHDHPEFPQCLARYLGERAPRSISVLGDPPPYPHTLTTRPGSPESYRGLTWEFYSLRHFRSRAIILRSFFLRAF
jgi:hypothetical protein